MKSQCAYMERSPERVSYDIHSILLLLIVRHPYLVSLHEQEFLKDSAKVHIISLVVDNGLVGP
jgi:hypothetical protein